MEGIANFVDDLLGGLRIIAFSLAIGGLFWIWAMLRLCPALYQAETALHRAFCWTRRGAMGLAVVLLFKLIVKAWVIAGALGEWPSGAYFGTVQFEAGLVQALLALLLAYAVPMVALAPRAIEWPQLTAGIAILLVVSGAWMVHAVGRLEHRSVLMALTVVHQSAAALWFGGVAQLLLMWRLKRQQLLSDELWVGLIRRFFVIGIAAVTLLLVTGLPMAWTYVGSWYGLVGTGYGSLLFAKIVLLSFALGFAYLNHKAGRQVDRGLPMSLQMQRVPYYIEAESFVLVTTVFVAATLSSQPPSVDIPSLTVPLRDVWEMFSPKMPRLNSPSHAELLAGEAGRVAIIDKIPSPAATDWSDYNHNMAGVILCVTSLVAVLGYWCGWRWARYWPVGFIVLGAFLFFRSDAETWPLGPIGFWESTFGNGEVLQHRIATFLVLVLGVMELRARLGRGRQRWPYVFPMLCAFGGILLLTHSHVEFEAKSEYLIQVTHTVMGLCAIGLATSWWLHLRLANSALAMSNRAGMTASTAMWLISLALLFYREPLQ